MKFEAARIPDGWAHTTLDAVCQILDARRVPVNSSERSLRIVGKSADNLYPYYGATGQVGVIDDFIFDGEHILLGEDGAPFLDPFKVKSYLVGGKFWVNNHAHILRSTVSNKYICHYLNQIDYSDHVTGTTRLKLTQDALRRIPVPVAPATEQHRIVAKIEELFSELDKGIENLKTAQVQLKVYRQAVLKHAFEGKLTVQWREENPGKIETPEQLLARIRQEREACYERQLKKWDAVVKEWEESGKSGKKPQRPKKPPEVTGLSHEMAAKLPLLPEGWLWARLGELSVVVGGLTKHQKRNSLPRRMKYLRVANVHADKILTDDIHEIGVTDSEARAVALNVGDMLIVEGNGSVDQIGRVAVWDGQLPVCGHQNHLIRTRLSENFAPRFFLQFLLSPVGRDLIVREASSTSGLHTLSISKVSNLVVPVTSFAEESATVAQIEERLSKADKMLEEVSTRNWLRRHALRQSILKKAFTGQLVPQDPNDEPASILLERIKAEKAAQGQNNTRARRRHTAATA